MSSGSVGGSIDPFIKHLNERLTTAEDVFIRADFSAASKSAVDILHELIVLTSQPSSSKPLVTPQPHTCTNQCVCIATVILLWNCHARQKNPAAIVSSMKEYYGAASNAPFSLFQQYIRILTQAHAEKLLVDEIDSYIKTNLTALTTAQLTALTSDMVFRVLLPLNRIDEAQSYTYKWERLDKSQMRQWRKEIKSKSDSAKTAANDKHSRALDDATSETQDTTHTLKSPTDATKNTDKSSALSSPSTSSRQAHTDVSGAMTSTTSSSSDTSSSKLSTLIPTSFTPSSIQSWIYMNRVWFALSLVAYIAYRNRQQIALRYDQIDEWIKTNSNVQFVLSELRQLMQFTFAIGFGRFL